MNTRTHVLLLFATALAMLTGVMAVQAVPSPAVLSLPDTSQTSTFQATIGEQVSVVVPSIINFGPITIGATNASVAATSAAQTVTVTGIALASGKKLEVSLEANAASFTSGAGPVFVASDVSWNAATWTPGIGRANTLTNTAFNEVGESNVNPGTTLTTTNLAFTLGVHNFGATAVQAGTQTLVATWEFQSF